ncbi:DUF5707 domain-containing protein [Streptomyces sp. NBC_01429]|uniref:DUF5707 domain-containing protein n=1 Tax=Streptomyces sp. NBC_01429 TaxID=2903862 RepID=UPI002E2B9174|nr:DUF5707 domain-containing protein [Streptomyces sp. NBC_01429]
MSKRIVVSSLIGAVALGGIAAGSMVWASTPSNPTVENSSARYVAPMAGTAGSLTFAAEVTDGSGIRDLKVLAWPKSSDLKPTAEELAHAEPATCRKTGTETSACTYTLPVSEDEAADMPEGLWYVSVLATANDGDTKFEPEAATFTFTR